MDILTENYLKALKLQRDRCGGKSAQRERDQLMEEAGEVLSAMGRMSRGRGTRHDFASEVADVVICLAALLERHGFSEEEFQKILDDKTRKWLASEEGMNAFRTALGSLRGNEEAEEDIFDNSPGMSIPARYCPECGEEAEDDCTCWQNEEDTW